VAGGIEFAPVLAARSALADRRRQGQVAGGDGQPALGAVPQRAHAEGSHRAPTGPPAPGVALPRPRACRRRWRRTLEASVKKAYDSKEYKDFMAQRGFGLLWGSGKDFAAFMAKGDADMKAVMTAVAWRSKPGAARRSLGGAGPGPAGRCCSGRRAASRRCRGRSWVPASCRHAGGRAGLMLWPGADLAQPPPPVRSGRRAWGRTRGQCLRDHGRDRVLHLAADTLGFLIVAPVGLLAVFKALRVGWRPACCARWPARWSCTWRSTSCCACRCPGACSARSTDGRLVTAFGLVFQPYVLTGHRAVGAVRPVRRRHSRG
jgi:hypothetical protein